MWLILFFTIFIKSIVCLPEQGVWLRDYTNNNHIGTYKKSLFKGSDVDFKIICNSTEKVINAKWQLRMTPCAEEYTFMDKELARTYLKKPNTHPFEKLYRNVTYMTSDTIQIKCSRFDDKSMGKSSKAAQEIGKQMKPEEWNSTGILPWKAWADGSYLLILQLSCGKECRFEAKVTVWMKSSYGYLSAIEWPFEIFYGIMSLIYAGYFVIWLALCACYWRDLLRVQLWITAVILLGLLEKVVFFIEYNSINQSGQSVRGAVIFAEAVSCFKRTVARLLVMIVCYGYGIIRPRLGVAQKKVVAIGVTYFTFALVEGCIRVLWPRFQPSNMLFYSVFPLALADALVLWWTFSYLVHTIREQRQRRNLVKYNLYRHFSNILILVVLVSIVFMVWSFYTFKIYECIRYWKELWVEEAFWHILFSVILLAMIWLWRPSNNNHRYAYSPVIDAEDMDEDVLMDNMATGDVKKISKGRENGAARSSRTEEDDLKWVEEHIPSSTAEQLMPLIESDEEINTAKMTTSKMQ